MDDELMGMDESEQSVKLVLPVGLIVALLVLFIVMRSRRSSREERSYRRILDAVEESELPARTRRALLDAVATVRSVREGLPIGRS